jgi:predicted alternative tryptophan synthase beta-subunit
VDADPGPSRRSPALAWLARGLALALAVVAGGVGVQAVRQQDACEAAMSRVAAVRPAVTSARVLADVHDVVDMCPVNRVTLVPLFALTGHGHADGTLAAAKLLTRANPDDYQGWLLLAFATRGTDGRLLRLSRAKIEQLGPTIKP